MSEPPGRLDPSRLSERLRAVPEWEIEGDRLTRTFRFPDFMGAVGFVNRLAPLAESAGHHPDLEVGWGRVIVELTTHDAGGLTDRDFDLAEQIDRI